MAESLSANYGGSRRYVDRQALDAWLNEASPYLGTPPVGSGDVDEPLPGRRKSLAPELPAGRPQGPLGVGTLGEAVREVPKTFFEGLHAMGSSLSEEGLGFWQRVGRFAGGAASTVFPFSSAGGHIYGRLFQELSEKSGELTDAALKSRLEHAKTYAPGEAAFYQAMLDTPRGQRGKVAYEGARLAGEAGFGMIPAYGTALKVAGRALGRGGKAAATAAEVVPPAGPAPAPAAEPPLRTAAEVAGAETRATRESAGETAGILLERQNTPMKPGEPGESTVLVVNEFGRPVEAPVRSPEELAVARRDAFRTMNRTPLEAPPRARVPEEPAAAAAEPLGELTTAGERAMARAEAALGEEFARLEAPGPGTTNVSTTRIPPGPASPTPAPAGLPRTMSDLMAQKGVPGAAPEAPPMAPSPHEPPRTMADLLAEKGAPGAAEAEAIAKEWGDVKPLLTDQTGAVQLGVLVRVALGGLAGAGAPADTPEERMRNALIGAGLGAALSRRTATVLAKALADERGAIDLTKFFQRRPAVQAGEQYQPNYERIAAEASVTRVMKNIHRAVADKITTAQRIPTSHAETQFEAARLIEKGDVSIQSILEGAPVDIEKLPEWSTAVRQINVGVATEAHDLARRMLAGEPVPPGELRRALAMSMEIGERSRVMQTRVGQTLSAQKIGARAPAEELLRPRVDPERLVQMTQEVAPNLDDMELAALVLKLERPATIVKATSFLSAFPRAMLEAMYFTLLSGKAVAKNMIGGMVVMPVSIAVRGVAPYMPRWGSQAPGVMAGEAFQMIHGMWEGMSEQVRMLREWDAPAWRAQLEGMGPTKREGIHAPAITAENFGLNPDGALGWATDWLGRGLRVPMEILNGTDAVFKAINGRMQHRVEAFRQATFEGLEGDAFLRRADELLEEPTKLTPEARLRIEDFKERQTFTKDLQGRVLSSLQSGPENPWLNLVYRNTVLPFFRTPVRIAEYGMQHTPGMNLLAAQFYRDIAAGGAARQIAQAKLAVGAGIIGMFGYMEAQGLITGSAPKDPALVKHLEQRGWQEKSFWDPILEKWRSYDGFEPITTLIATGADISAAMRHLPESDALTLFMAGVLSQVNNLDSKTYTQGISDLTKIIRAPGTDAQVEKAMEFLRRRLAMLVPIGAGALAEVESVVDPARRRVIPSGAASNPFTRELQALLDYYRSRIPGLSSARNADGEFVVPPWRNSITGEVEVTENFPFLPFPGRAPKNDVVFNEIIRLKGAGLQELPTHIGRAEAANVGLQPVENRPGVRLTPQEYDRWVVLMTQGVRNDAGATYYEALRDMITSPMYAALDAPRPQTEMLNAIEGEFKTRAQRELLDEYPKLKALFTERQIEHTVGGAPRAMQETLRQSLRGAAGLSLGR